MAAPACTKKGPAAPVKNGSFLVYAVTESFPTGAKTYDARLTFTEQGNLFTLKFDFGGQAETPPPMQVDAALVPSDNVIPALNIGRLWLPPEGRAVGKRTPCGAVGAQQKFRRWDVFVVDGLCGRAAGSRYYESSTGMLVGFQFSGGIEIGAYLKDSG
jgi:hypothetical protein